jgi:hypothetical protein
VPVASVVAADALVVTLLSVELSEAMPVPLTARTRNQ